MSPVDLNIKTLIKYIDWQYMIIRVHSILLQYELVPKQFSYDFNN